MGRHLTAEHKQHISAGLLRFHNSAHGASAVKSRRSRRPKHPVSTLGPGEPGLPGRPRTIGGNR